MPSSPYTSPDTGGIIPLPAVFVGKIEDEAPYNDIAGRAQDPPLPRSGASQVQSPCGCPFDAYIGVMMSSDSILAVFSSMAETPQKLSLESAIARSIFFLSSGLATKR